MKKTTAAKVQDALDALGLALTNHRHRWTDAERRLYERSTAALRREMRGADVAP